MSAVLGLRETVGVLLRQFGPAVCESASLQVSGLVWSGPGSFGYGLAEQGTHQPSKHSEGVALARAEH